MLESAFIKNTKIQYCNNMFAMLQYCEYTVNKSKSHVKGVKLAQIIENPPSAKMLMNSMRSLGYTFETALADIVDNSITAKATKILISFPTSSNDCFVSICDNGVGMTSQELFAAMRYGRDPRENRSEDDLGRFGLGMKSASLSQCTKLTVISKKDGEKFALTRLQQ